MGSMPSSKETGSALRLRFAKRYSVLVLLLILLISSLAVPGCSKAPLAIDPQDIPPKSFHPSLEADLENRIKTHIQFLAGDFCAGRQFGTKGATRSAQYVMDEFKTLGLSPGSKNQYYQIFTAGGIPEWEASLSIIDQKGNELDKLQRSKDFIQLNPPVFFTISKSELNPKWTQITVKNTLLKAPKDDSSWKTLKPKSIILAKEESSDISHILNSATESKCGAVLLVTPSSAEGPLVAGKSATGPDAPVVLIVTEDAYSRLEKNLGQTVEISLKLNEGPARTGINVVGVLGDPSKKPTVLILAHRDSLAIEKSKTPKLIPAPGAIDNASGTAALIEIAKELKNRDDFRGAAVFLSTDGEEWGLLGANDFIKNLFFDKANLKYVINLDCVGAIAEKAQPQPLEPSKTFESVESAYEINIYATPRNGLVDSVRSHISGACRTLNMVPKVVSAPYQSDHVPFEKMGLPTIAFYSSSESCTGLHSPKDTANRVHTGAVGLLVRAIVEGVVNAGASWK